MKNYFTSIEKINEVYIGTLHDSDTNQAIYKTAAYPSHRDAIIDVNTHLQQLNNNDAAVSDNTPVAINVPSPVEQTITSEQPVRRCCGR